MWIKLDRDQGHDPQPYLTCVIVLLFQSDVHDYAKMKRKGLQVTKKLNCSAAIYVRSVLAFPAYKVWSMLYKLQTLIWMWRGITTNISCE